MNAPSEKDNAKAIAHEIMNKRKKENKKDFVRFGSYYLFFITGLNFLGTLFNYISFPNIVSIVIGSMFTLFTLVMAILSIKRPFWPMLITLIIYVFLFLVQLSLLVMYYEGALRTVLLLVPIVVLSIGSYNAYKFRKKKKKEHAFIIDDNIN